MIDTTVKVTNSADGKPKYFRVLLLQGVFSGEATTQKLAIGQQLDANDVSSSVDGEFVDDPEDKVFANVKAPVLGDTIYQVEAHEKLKKKA